jgi:2-polyprenyl-3-methyl-5-hydroxy-6-metoxy-1,4-benzoquinol methylase
MLGRFQQRESGKINTCGQSARALEEPEFGLFVEGNDVSIADYYLHLNRYRFASGFVKDKLCLDVGCGVGYGSAYLVRKGATKVIGGDKSEDALSYARNTARTSPDGALEFRQFDATFLPFANNSFDMVVSLEVIEHVKDYEGLLSELHRVLRRSGKLILSTPNRETGAFMFKTDWKHHAHEFSKEELLGLMNEYFASPVVYGQYLLNKKSLILRRLRRTMAGLLEIAGLWALGIWLGRLLFRHNHLVVYKTEGFDNLSDGEGEVVPLTEDLAPTTFVVVATKP